MTKTQKTWLSVFLAMIFVPLLLWIGGVRGSIDIPWYPISDFIHFLNILISYFLILLPLIGFVGILLTVRKLKMDKKIKILIYAILIPLIGIFSFLVLTLLYVMIFYINGGPQIG